MEEHASRPAELLMIAHAVATAIAPHACFHGQDGSCGFGAGGALLTPARLGRGLHSLARVAQHVDAGLHDVPAQVEQAADDLYHALASHEPNRTHENTLACNALRALFYAFGTNHHRAGSGYANSTDEESAQQLTTALQIAFKEPLLVVALHVCIGETLELDEDSWPIFVTLINDKRDLWAAIELAQMLQDTPNQTVARSAGDKKESTI